MQPGPDALRLAVRDVVQNCIYGVDLNPLAVDLCKVALWIEGFAAGMPLNFLDHRIKCGNSLVGVFDLEVLREGIPDGAYAAVTGDDKKLASSRKKDNKEERKGQRSLFEKADFESDRSQFAQLWQEMGAIPEQTPEQIRQKQAQYQASRENAQWWNDRSACNLWTAAFFTPITAEGLALVPTTAALARLLDEAKKKPENRVTVSGMVEAANQLAEELRFFHWPLEFPEVFEQGGFDCVLGNPPWERIKLQEKEFFASRDYEIATAQNKAAREKLIKTLPERKPELAVAWKHAKHEAESQGIFIRESQRFLLTSRGDINTYAVFSELARNLIAGQGRSGIIVPVGIGTDNTTKDFFGDLIKSQSLAQLIGFENEAFIFSEVHNAFKFCILSMTGANESIQETDFVFFCRYFKQIEDQQRHFNLSPSDISLINPNTFTCPIFRSKLDAEITRKIYRKVPVLENETTGENPWGISFMSMFHMSNDSGLFHNEPSAGRLPLYEAKMFHQFDHRFSTYEGATQADMNAGRLPQTTAEMKQDFDFAVMPRYWVEKKEVESRLHKWGKRWLLSFRGITNTTSDRTAIFSLLPILGLGNSAPIAFLEQSKTDFVSCLVANLSSLIFDFVTRQKVGGNNFNFFIVKQLPVIPPETYTQTDINFIAPRVLELTYTAWDIKPFAEDMWNPTLTPLSPLGRGAGGEGLQGSEGTTSILTQTSNKQQLSLGLDLAPAQQQLELSAPENPDDPIPLRQLFLEQWQANWHETPIPSRTPLEQVTLDPTCDELPIPPFIWNEDRRAILRAELDAYYAKLYGLTRDELRYILDPADVYGTDFPSETFRVLKNNEIKKYGEYRTQRLVLEAWDKLGF